MNNDMVVTPSDEVEATSGCTVPRLPYLLDFARPNPALAHSTRVDIHKCSQHWNFKTCCASWQASCSNGKLQ
jgi:hypothetical protein